MTFNNWGRICGGSSSDIDFDRRLINHRPNKRTGYVKNAAIEKAPCFCADLLNAISSDEEDFDAYGDAGEGQLFTEKEMEDLFEVSENKALRQGLNRLPEELSFLICALAFSTLKNVADPDSGFIDLSSERIPSLLSRLKILDEVVANTENAIFLENRMVLRQAVGRKVQQLAVDHLKEAIYLPQVADMTFYSKIVRSLGGKHVLRALIFKTLKDGDEVKVQDLICLYETARGKLDFFDRKGRTPLHYASHSSVIHKLVEFGVDVNAQDKKGRTALHLATSLECVDALISHGAIAQIKDDKGNTPLHHFEGGAELAHVEIINSLVLAGIDPNEQNNEGETPLHTLENSRDCSFLISAGADVWIKDIKGREPLHVVQNASKARLLLACDANVNAVDSKGDTPLHLVVDLQIARVFIVNNADIEKKNALGNIPKVIQDDPDFLEKVLI